MSSGAFGVNYVGAKFVRNITKVLKSATGVLFGRVTSGTGRGEELTPTQVRSLLSVYTVAQTDTAISTAVNNLIGGSPGLLDTLDELAAALGDDANFASTVTTSLAGKQATLVSGTNIKTINSTSLLGSGDITVSASPGGSSGQFQWNSSGSFAGTTAVIYATTVTHVTVTAQSSSAIPVCVKGAASQSGNLFEARTNANVLGARITSACRFSDNPAGVDSGERFGVGSVTTDDSAAFGTNAISNVYRGTAIGKSSYAGLHCTSIGTLAGAVSTGGGVPTSHGFSNCIILADGTNNAGPTASHQYIVFGTFSESFFGKGVTNSSPTASIRFQGGGGSGTNIAGTSVVWAAGKSTGSATPATFTVQTTTVGSSGTTLQTLRDAIQVDGNATSGETPMLLLDIAKGTLQRVSIGAADSGGAGFKVLRVPN